MNCDCVDKIDEKLAEKNLRLACTALSGEDYSLRVYLKADWIDRNKAPRGDKNRPPNMYASHCPWCGVKIAKKDKK